MGDRYTSGVVGSEDERLRRSKAGAEAKAAGKAFEGAIDAELLTLQQRGYVAHFHPNNPGWRRVGPRWMPTEASGADRSIVLRGATACPMEIKSTGSTPAGKPKAFTRDRISLKQEAELEQCARTGGPAFLALEFRGVDAHVWCLVPWLEVPWAGKKSVQLDALLGFIVPRGGFGEAFLTRCGSAIRGR